MRFTAIFIALLFVIIPFATAIEINPSVESQPFYCRFSFSSWICDIGASGGQGPQGPQGFPGSGNTSVAFKGARAYNTGDTSLTENVWTQINYNSETFDTDSIHSTSTNTDRLTATTGGYYLITLGTSSDNATFTHSRINYNGVTTISSQTQYGAADERFSLSALYYLNCGDFVNSSMRASATGVKSKYYPDFSPVFTMYKVG